jgi:hypothetical protein
MRYSRLWGCLYLAGGCASAVTDGGTTGGAGGGSSAETSSANSYSSGGPADPAQCITQEDQASCEKLGCLYLDAELFPSTAGMTPECLNGIPTKVCSYHASSPFQSVSTWRRDVPEGRLVMLAGVVTAVAGFEACNTGSDDACTCFTK